MIIGYKPDFDRSELKQYSVWDRFETRAKSVLGRKVNIMPMLGQEVIGYDMLEALLTCITVYGPDNWHDYARRKARAQLEDGYRRLSKAYHIICRMEKELESKIKIVSDGFLEFTKERNFFSVLGTACRFSAC